MGKLKVSVIGVGHLGTIHANLWDKNENVDFIGVYDIESDKAEKIALQHNCRNFDSLGEAIEKSDAVTIATPTVNHLETAKPCIEAGKDCLIEKPITGTHNEALELIELAEKYNVLIQVGHVERFNPVINAIKDYSLDPLFIEAHRLTKFQARATDVSVVHDLMIHDIDIMLWLIKSNVKNIYANGVAVITDTTDIANARIEFENGAVANLTASRISAHPMRKIRLFQRNAYLSIDFAELNVEVYKMTDDISEGDSAKNLGKIDLGMKNRNIIFEQPKVKKINAIEEEQKAFIEAITEKHPAIVGPKEAAKALLIAEEIAKQAYTEVE